MSFVFVYETFAQALLSHKNGISYKGRLLFCYKPVPSHKKFCFFMFFSILSPSSHKWKAVRAFLSSSLWRTKNSAPEWRRRRYELCITLLSLSRSGKNSCALLHRVRDGCFSESFGLFLSEERNIAYDSRYGYDSYCDNCHSFHKTISFLLLINNCFLMFN